MELELTEYVLLAFLVILGVLVRHRLQRRKVHQPLQQAADSPKSGDVAPAARKTKDRRSIRA